MKWGEGSLMVVRLKKGIRCKSETVPTAVTSV